MFPQTLISPDDPAYLPSKGCNAVYFNELTAPPIGLLDKEVLYCLDDHVLYYNGSPVAVGGSTIADSLATTGAPVNVSAAAPPAAGDVLTATGPTDAAWVTPATQFQDNEFFILDNADNTNRVAFDVGGTGETTTVIATNPTFDRLLVLPDVSGTSLAMPFGPAGISRVGELPAFIALDGRVGSSQVYIRADGLLDTAICDVAYIAGTRRTVFGKGNLNTSLAGTGSVVVGSDCGAPLGDLSESVLIGDSIMRTSATNGTVSDSVIVGSEFAFAGNVTTMNGHVSVGYQNGFSLTSGVRDTIIGSKAGQGLTSGSNNVMIGYNCGNSCTTGSDNVYVGYGIPGVAAEANVTRIGNTTQAKAFIGGVRGVTTDVADALPVLIDSAGQLGTTSSSIKYKQNVRDLSGSEVVYSMRPVAFNYKSSPDREQIGLIAEEVEKVYPDMCIYTDSELYSVDYARLSILLLAEVKKLKSQIDRQNEVLKELARFFVD